ncbi:MAG: hypothetical protein ABSD98_08425 [Candidatus Korobacteraceae bacterium]|jgi:predicted transcriptional regulator
MEVHLTAEQAARLDQLAGKKGQPVEKLAQQVLVQYLDHEANFVEAVERGFASLDRGEYVDHQEVGERIRRRFES